MRLNRATSHMQKKLINPFLSDSVDWQIIKFPFPRVRQITIISTGIESLITKVISIIKNIY